ncbi:hypothetical protein Emed_005578 [Eimeria media]
MSDHPLSSLVSQRRCTRCHEAFLRALQLSFPNSTTRNRSRNSTSASSFGKDSQVYVHVLGRQQHLPHKQHYQEQQYNSSNSSSNTHRVFDCGAYLCRQASERVLFLFSELTSSETEKLIAQLILLDQERDSRGRMHQPIHLHIHSPGGPLTHALALVDLMQSISSPLCTINCGLCASSASLLLAGGTPGSRYALEGSRLLLHQPMGALAGPLRELRVEAEGVERVGKQVQALYR